MRQEKAELFFRAAETPVCVLGPLPITTALTHPGLGECRPQDREQGLAGGTKDTKRDLPDGKQ